ncbi:hypothetical protein, partial [Klebsiella pneumoniae]|uniref:hypothetical protein n=1 Tax=Klebsiella pneumoniae TaxID=573 RepID=UPI00195477C2
PDALLAPNKGPEHLLRAFFMASIVPARTKTIVDRERCHNRTTALIAEMTTVIVAPPRDESVIPR